MGSPLQAGMDKGVTGTRNLTTLIQSTTIQEGFAAFPSSSYSAYRAIAEILHFAHEHYGLAHQPRHIGRYARVEVGPRAWGRPLLQEVCQEVSRSVSSQR